MPIKHTINEIALVERPLHMASRIEIRCTCGVLILSSQLAVFTPENLDMAFDKHMIGILEYVWVRQFYQAES